MSKEAMKLALEALEQIAAYRPLTFAECSDAEAVMRIAENAIPYLREALAEQHEMTNIERHERNVQKFLAEQPAQQEPVLQDIEQYRLQMAGICTAAIGYWKEGDGIHPDYDTVALRDVAKLYAKYDELYRAQSAQRTWVGLTDEEILAVARDHYSPHQRPEISFARAIEAAHGIKGDA